MKYETIKALVEGCFNVRTVERSREQNNAITQFHRNIGRFSVTGGKLYYDNKEVIESSSLQRIVKENFDKTQGCGARPLSQTLRRQYHGLTVRRVRDQYVKSRDYHRMYPRFTNSSTLTSIKANKVNERWQIDLIDLSHESVKDDNRHYKYILSVPDVFSRFVLLRRLQSKSSEGVARELERIFANHGRPEAIQCDQGT